jgi:hypothetical protein
LIPVNDSSSAVSGADVAAAGFSFLGVPTPVSVPIDAADGLPMLGLPHPLLNLLNEAATDPAVKETAGAATGSDGFSFLGLPRPLVVDADSGDIAAAAPSGFSFLGLPRPLLISVNEAPLDCTGVV